MPGLDLIVTYAYNKTRVAEETDPNFGAQLPAAPKHSASAFIRYSIEDGALKGLSANAGLTYASRIQASLPSTIFIAEDARLDLGAAYEIDERFRLGVNVNNVTNSRSYVTNLFALYPLTPRQVLFTLSGRFGEGK